MPEAISFFTCSPMDILSLLNLIDRPFGFTYQAPSVVFIDELDAVGRERGLIKGSGGQERDATLNQVHHGIKFPTATMEFFLCVFIG